MNKRKRLEIYPNEIHGTKFLTNGKKVKVKPIGIPRVYSVPRFTFSELERQIQDESISADAYVIGRFYEGIQNNEEHAYVSVQFYQIKKRFWDIK